MMVNFLLNNLAVSHFRLQMHLLPSFWIFVQGQSQYKHFSGDKKKKKKGIFFNCVLSWNTGPQSVSLLLGKKCAVTLKALNLPPLFLELLLLSSTSYGNEYPFGQLGSAALVLSPYNLCIPSLLCRGAAWEIEKA